MWATGYSGPKAVAHDRRKSLRTNGFPGNVVGVAVAAKMRGQMAETHRCARNRCSSLTGLAPVSAERVAAVRIEERMSHASVCIQKLANGRIWPDAGALENALTAFLEIRPSTPKQ